MMLKNLHVKKEKDVKNAKGDAPWTEAQALNNTNVKWVRVDPYYDCLCHIVFFGISRKHAIAPLFL